MIPHRVNLLALLLDREADRLLQRQYQLSYHEYLVLLAIAQHEGAQQTVLVEFVGLSKGAVSKLLAILVSRELVRIQPSPTSRRSNGVCFTKKGRQQTAAASAMLEKVFMAFFDRIATHQEIGQFSRMLDVLIEKFHLITDQQ